jgi:hypothetical protein
MTLPTPPADVVPTHFVLIYPSDWAQLGWGVGKEAEIEALVSGAVEEFREWLARETGHTINAKFQAWHSKLSTLELGSTPGTSDGSQLDGCTLAMVPQGQGVHTTQALETVMYGEMGIPVQEPGPNLLKNGTRNMRAAIVINAGGYRGGNWGGHEKEANTNNSGVSVVGDWQIRYVSTGRFDPCAFKLYGDASGRCGVCSESFKGSIMHEWCNMMGVDPYVEEGTSNKYIGSFDDHMSPEQKANFLRRSAEYVYPVPVAPTPPPPPPPAPVVTGVTISGPATLPVGSIATYTAKATYSDGTTINVNNGFISSNYNVLNVADAGKAAANTIGTAIVANMKGGQLGVTVSKPRPWWWPWWRR